MTYREILSAAQSLPESERRSLVKALSNGNQCEAIVPESSRLSSLLEKQGRCPHCGGSRYYRFGKDRGTQRFKCKDCGRTFTEYTGTWQHKLHKKELVRAYMRQMSEQKSLDKISAALHIKQEDGLRLEAQDTAFPETGRWRLFHRNNGERRGVFR